MSDTSNDKENGLDLSALSFGPSWARDKKPKKDYSDYAPKDGAKSRKGSFKKGAGKRNDDRRSNNRGQRPGNDKRSFNKGGDRAPRFQPVAAPEGFTGEVMPIEDGLDRLAQQILQTARTYSVFDLARLVLQSRERFNVGLKAPKDAKIFRNIRTFATYLTKEEAIADLWNSDNKEQFYTEVIKEVEAPSGNFTSVARCTKTGVFLGPPNFHSYQTNLHALHRERFSNLSFEAFQHNIETLKDEDSINAWLESEKTQTYYLPLEPSSVNLQPAAKPTSEEKVEAPVESGEEAPSPEAESKPETEATPEAPSAAEIDESMLIKTRSELEAHFAQNNFDKLYKQVQISWVPSTITKRLLSPGLFTLLKDTISEEKRYPGKLSSLMCRQLSGRNVAVFKLQKKLKAGPSRPHAIPSIETLSERPQKLLKWALANDGKGIDQLWSDILPKDISEDDKAQWYHDLKWLLTQGFVTLMEEGQVYFSKKQENTPPAPKVEESAKSDKTPATKPEATPPVKAAEDTEKAPETPSA